MRGGTGKEHVGRIVKTFTAELRMLFCREEILLKYFKYGVPGRQWCFRKLL